VIALVAEPVKPIEQRQSTKAARRGHKQINIYATKNLNKYKSQSSVGIKSEPDREQHKLCICSLGGKTEAEADNAQHSVSRFLPALRG